MSGSISLNTYDLNAADVRKSKFPLPETCNNIEVLTENGDVKNNITKPDVRFEERRVKEDTDDHHRCTTKYWQIGSVISCFLANLLTGALGNSYGVLYTYMQAPLGITEYQISWIGALMTGFHGIAAILAMVLIDSKGCRMTSYLGPTLAASGVIVGSQSSNIYVLYLTLGVLPGVGLSLSYVATMVHVNRQFTRWRPFAVAVSVTGIAIGILIWPPMTSAIANIMGWRGALLISGAVLLHLVPCSFLIKPTTPGKQMSDNQHHDDASYLEDIQHYFEIFKAKGTIIVSLVNFFTGLSYYTFSNFVPSYVMSSVPDMTLTDAAFIISVAGVGTAAARCLFAVGSMVHPKAPQNIFTFSLCLCGITYFVVPLCGNMASHLANGVLFGIGLGGWNCMASVVYVNLFGIDKLSKTFGTFSACLGFGAFCGPPLESYIASLLDSPGMVFYSGGGFYIVATVLMLPLMVKRQTVWRRRKSITISVVGVRNDGFSSESV